MEYAIWFLLLVAVTVLGLHLVGRTLPREHRALRSTRIRAVPDEVFRTITDVEAFPQWRKDVRSVEKLGLVSGRRRYREISSQGTLAFEVTEEIPGRRLVTTIIDEGQPFGGRWTIDLGPVGDETEVTITEDGFVNPPIFRFISRYVFGQTAALETYLRNLEKRLDVGSR
jgi:uncharacterized protein YndB with AHSA1/START domain